MTKETVQAYWQKFLSTLPPDSSYRSKTYIAEGWETALKWQMNSER